MIDGSVVVTGADRPLGKAVATRLAGDVDGLILGGADGAQLEDLAEELAGSGQPVKPVRADPRDEFDIERLVEIGARGEDLGAVIPSDRIVHRDPAAPLETASYAAFDDLIRHNVRGVYATVREALGHGSPETAVVVPIKAVEAPADLLDVGEVAIAALVRALADYRDGPTKAVPLSPFPVDTASEADQGAEDVVREVRELTTSSGK